tara:strand:- start:16446 stop:17030 length:585 start_codon:yes stop_codon:yes gene_type:complete
VVINRRKWIDNALQPVKEDGDAKDKKNSNQVFRLEILPMIKDFFNEDGIALDVGCGNGRFSFQLAKYHSYVHALDVMKYFDSMFASHNVEFFKVPFEEYEPANSTTTYSTIFFFGSFYTFGNTGYINTVNKCLSLLDRGGHIIIVDNQKRLVSDDAKKVKKGHYQMKDFGKEINVVLNAIQWNGVHRVLVLERK